MCENCQQNIHKSSYLVPPALTSLWKNKLPSKYRHLRERSGGGREKREVKGRERKKERLFFPPLVSLLSQSLSLNSLLFVQKNEDPLLDESPVPAETNTKSTCQILLGALRIVKQELARNI